MHGAKIKKINRKLFNIGVDISFHKFSNTSCKILHTFDALHVINISRI